MNARPAPLSLVRRSAVRLRDDERGAGFIGAFIILFSMLLVAGVGLMVDTARIVSTDRQMEAIALEAARAGANALDAANWRSGGAGPVVVDPAEAQAAASSAVAAFVTGSAATLSSVSVNGTEVSVTVSATVNPRFPLMSTRTVSGSASAQAASGITQEGQ